MPYSIAEIRQTLRLLEKHTADELETDTLEFKECSGEEKLRDQALELAVCFGNGQGGTVVFGVKDHIRGFEKAIVGIDFAPDLMRLTGELYDRIDPKLPVEFEWLEENSRRILLMHVRSVMPPYTTSSGKGWIRVGRECKPLTGSLLRQLREKSGINDITADLLPITTAEAVSPAAMEILRREMKEMNAPSEMLAFSDAELCQKLGIAKNGKMTVGGLLAVGKEEMLARFVPNHEWKYSRMRSDTEYDSAPLAGRESIFVALDKLTLLVGQKNPVTIIPSGLFHPEFPQYPMIAWREAIMNAFAHRDYSIPGMVFIRHWPDRLEINSPGAFIGGVNPQNILHHPPVTRNRYLVETILMATRLVNRSNLGVPRIFRALLEEGKEPPIFEEAGDVVKLTFLGQKVDQGFQRMINELLYKQGATIDTDDLLLLHAFSRRRELQWNELKQVYPYDERRLHEKLARLEHGLGMIRRAGTGRGTTYILSRQAVALIDRAAAYDMSSKLDGEAIKVRILSLVAERPLTNKELRTFTDLNRAQATSLLQELAQEGQIHLQGHGAGARWHAGPKR